MESEAIRTRTKNKNKNSIKNKNKNKNKNRYKAKNTEINKSYGGDSTPYSEDKREVNLILWNQPECERGTSESITPGKS